MNHGKPGQVLMAFLAAIAAGCSSPRDEDLSYPSNLWKVYDERPRYLVAGDRALPRSPYAALEASPKGVFVIGKSRVELPVRGYQPSPEGISTSNTWSLEFINPGAVLVLIRSGRRFLSPNPCGKNDGPPPAGAFPLPDSGLVVACEKNLFVGSEGPAGKLSWKTKNLALYVEGMSSIQRITPYKSGLAAATDRGVAISTRPPFDLWRVLGKASGLPEQAPVDILHSAGHIWVLYPERLYRSTDELLRLLNAGSPGA